jgi:iron(III) transport system substrate-binding protein
MPAGGTLWRKAREFLKPSEEGGRRHMRNVRIGCSVAAFLFLFLLPFLAWSQDRAWEQEWNKTLAAGRKEGKVVLIGSPDPVVRKELTAKFQERFGITLEYQGVRSGEAVGRVRNERQAGVYSVDAWMGGTITLATVHYAEKWIDPLKPALILPEVINPSKWKPGKLWFMDPEEKYVLRMINYASSMISLNTSLVKPEEIKSVNDLLLPRWKGKMSAYIPTLQGSGANVAGYLYANLGEEFVRKLYVEQQPAISRDFRQMADWLARGNYPVALSMREEEVERLRKEGLPIITVYDLQGIPSRSVAGIGTVALMNRAPHPNAARVFVNWIASREGLETYSRAYGTPTLRNDVDESFLSPGIIPRKGQKYFDASSWEFATSTEEKVRLRLAEMLK